MKIKKPYKVDTGNSVSWHKNETEAYKQYNMWCDFYAERNESGREITLSKNNKVLVKFGII